MKLVIQGGLDLKKFLLIMLLLLILIIVLIQLRFGSALFQEGNPSPILISIMTLELSNGDYEQFYESSILYHRILEVLDTMS